MYIRDLWTTLRGYYIDFIEGILNIFDLYSWYVNIFSLYLKYIKHIFDHIISILD
jgi:hypothetical protein